MIHIFTSPSELLTDLPRYLVGWLNPNKNSILARLSSFSLARNRRKRSLLTFPPLVVLDNEMDPADSVRNSGVFFDSGLNFRQHISQVSSSCFYHIRDLKRIRKSLPLALAKQIAVAL